MKKQIRNTNHRKKLKAIIGKTSRARRKSKIIRAITVIADDTNNRHVSAKFVEKNMPSRTLKKAKTIKKSAVKKTSKSCLNIAPVPPIPSSNKKNKKTKQN